MKKGEFVAYTIYLSKGKLNYPKGKSNVLYISQSGDGVNKRLKDHLSGKVKARGG